MDDIDIQILRMLERDGRASHEEIGRQLNLSRPTIHQRVKKLEAEGVIKRYKAMIDWSKLGQTINVFIYAKDGLQEFYRENTKNLRNRSPGHRR